MQMPAPLPVSKWMLMLVAALALFSSTYFLKEYFSIGYPLLVEMVAAGVITGMMIMLYRLWRWFVEKRYAGDLQRPGMFLPLLKGCLIGVVLYILCTSASVAFGIYRIELTGASFLQPLPALLFCFMVGVSEEIIFRGIIFRYIDTRFNFWVALVISALLFGLAHCPRPWVNVSEIILGMGLLQAVLYKYGRTLWLPIGMHFAWNFLCSFFQGERLTYLLYYEAPLKAIPCETGFAIGSWQGIESASISIILHLLLLAFILTRLKDI